MYFFNCATSSGVTAALGGGTALISLPLFSTHVLQDPAVGSTCPKSGSTAPQQIIIQATLLSISIVPFQILAATKTDKPVLAGVPGLQTAGDYRGIDLRQWQAGVRRCFADQHQIGDNPAAPAQQNSGVADRE